jgi:hypothetical protein
MNRESERREFRSYHPKIGRGRRTTTFGWFPLGLLLFSLDNGRFVEQGRRDGSILCNVYDDHCDHYWLPFGAGVEARADRPPLYVPKP